MNCYLEGASDVPAAGENPGQPKEQQDPARAAANEADPQKGKPAGRACSRCGGYNHRPQPIGRPVTSAGHQNATPLGVAFRVSGPILGKGIQESPQASRAVPLPAGALGCSIGLAYQAADASHPNRAERARRRARKFRRIDYFFIRHTAETPIGRALPEENAGRAESIQRTGGSSCGVSVQRSARQQWGRSSGDRGRLSGARLCGSLPSVL